MIRRQLERYLRDADYYSLPTNLPEFSAFVKVENNFLNIIQIIDYPKSLYLSSDQYMELKEAVKTTFLARGEKNIHIMTLILFEDYEKARSLVQDDRFCWFIDVKTRELIIEQEKTPDFYGLKSFLKEFLDHYIEQTDLPEVLLSEKETDTYMKRCKQYLLDMPKATVIIVTINIIIFIFCAFTGNTLYSLGQISLSYIKVGEYYRIITSIFLHSGLDHIFSNMLLLYFIGDMIERVIGSKRFLAVYFISGILGNITSCLYELLTEESMVSVGASGAIFGLIGGMLYLVIRKNDAIEISLSRMLVMVTYCIYSSFAGSNINVPAHLGGLVSGIFITWTLSFRRKKSEG